MDTTVHEVILMGAHLRAWYSMYQATSFTLCSKLSRRSRRCGAALHRRQRRCFLWTCCLTSRLVHHRDARQMRVRAKGCPRAARCAPSCRWHVRRLEQNRQQSRVNTLIDGAGFKGLCHRKGIPRGGGEKGKGSTQRRYAQLLCYYPQTE